MDLVVSPGCIIAHRVDASIVNCAPGVRWNCYDCSTQFCPCRGSDGRDKLDKGLLGTFICSNPYHIIILLSYTVNVEILRQYICWHISARTLDARKFDVSENYYNNITNRITWYVHKNQDMRICSIEPDVRKLR